MLKRLIFALALLFPTFAAAQVVNIPGFDQQSFTNASGSWLVSTIIAQPLGNETTGKVYLISSLGTGQFSTHSNQIAILTANQGWFFVAPSQGMKAYVQDSGAALIYQNGAWVPDPQGGLNMLVTPGSSYDARTCKDNRSNCTDVGPVLNAAISAAVTLGANCDLRLGGVPVVLRSNVTVPAGCTLSENTPPNGVTIQSGTGANPYYDQGGYIAKSPTAVLTISGRLNDVAIIPDWYTTGVVASVTNTRTLFDNVLHRFTGTGLVLNGEKASANHIEIGGFDIGVNMSGTMRAHDTDWTLDNNNDIYNHATGDDFTVDGANHHSMFGAQFQRGGVKVKVWEGQVTGMGPDGATDHVKITYKFTAGDDQLATAGEGLWLIGAGDDQMVSATGDVPTCASPPCTVANIPDENIGDLVPGMTVSGACIAAGSLIVPGGVDYGTGNDDGSVTIDHATTCAETGEALTFTASSVAPVGQNGVWQYSDHAAIDSTHASIVLRGSSWAGPTDTNASYTAGSNAVLLTNTVNWAPGQFLCASSCTGSPADMVAPTGFAVADATLVTAIGSTTSKPNIAVSTTANWPDQGVIRIDTEELWYRIVWGTDTDKQGNRLNTISITQRGFGGTTAAMHSSSATVEVGPPQVVAPLPSQNVANLGRAGIAVNALAQSTQTGKTVTGANDRRTVCTSGCATIALQGAVHTWTTNTEARIGPNDVYFSSLTASGGATTLTVPYALGARLQPGMNVTDQVDGTTTPNLTIASISSDYLTVTLSGAIVGGFSNHNIKFAACGYPADQPWMGNCIATFAINTEKASGTAYVHAQAHGVRGFFRFRDGQNGTLIDAVLDNGGAISPLTDLDSFGIFCTGDCDKISSTGGKLAAFNAIVMNPSKNTAGISISNVNLRAPGGFALFAGNIANATVTSLHGEAGLAYVDSTALAVSLSAINLPNLKFYYDDPTLSAVNCNGDSSSRVADNWCPGIYGAANAGQSYSTQTITALRTSNLNGAPTVYLAGMVTKGDTGAGLFRNMNTTTCTDDRGVIVKDVNGNCFKRDGIEHTPVSLKMYGYTAGSDQATFCDGGDCLAKAFAAAQTYGNNQVTTDGLVVTSSSDVAPLSNQDFTCGSTYEGLQTSADFTAVPGSIIFTHGHGLRATSINNSTIHHCVILTNGSGGSTITLHPTTQRNLLDNIKNWTANADTGVMCNGEIGGESIRFEHLQIIGFDNALTIYKCSRAHVSYIMFDANVGYFQGPEKAPVSVDHVDAFNFLENNVTGKNLALDYSALSSGSGGVCRVTVSSTSAFATGDWVNLVMDRVAGDVNMGPLSCYGVYQATVVDGTHIDLQGSVYGTGLWYTSGTASWTSGSYVIHVPPPATTGGQGIYAGETVNCGGGARTGTVKYASNYAPPTNNGGSGLMDVVIDSAAASSSTGTCTFTNLGTYVHGAASCSNTTPSAADSGCLYLYTTERFVAGNSYAGRATNNTAACVFVGGPGDTSPGGFLGGDIYCFGYRHQYDAQASGPFVCTPCSGDAVKELLDPAQINVHYGSGTPPLSLSGTTTNGSKIIALTFDPRQAGWAVGDFLTGTGIPNDGSSCGGSAITALSATTATINSNATASGTVTITDQLSNSAACLSYSNYTSAAYVVGPQISGGGYVVLDSGSAGVNTLGALQVNPLNLGTPALVVTRGKVNIDKVYTTQNNAFIFDSSATQVQISNSGSVTANTGPIYWDGITLERGSQAVGNFFQGGGTGNFANFGDQTACDSTHIASDQITVSACKGSIMAGNPTGGACGDGCIAGMTVRIMGYSAAGTAAPSCASGNKGTRITVLDAVTGTFGSTYASGGALVRPAFCDGSNWVIGMLENWRLDWPRTPANDNDLLEERRYG